MIAIENLSKSYGKKNVINNLNLEIESGAITSLVGKNGSGKSTLIRMISGLIKPDEGKIKTDKNEKMGVLLGGDVSLYANLTGYEILEFFGGLYNMKKADIYIKIEEMDSILDMSDFLNKRSYTFSRGMKQKVALTIATLHDPDILLLDEPSTGLDIDAANDVISFLEYLKSKDKTILIATHNIFEISDLSDNIAFLKNGKISKKVKTSEFFSDSNIDNKSKLLLNEI